MTASIRPGRARTGAGLAGGLALRAALAACALSAASSCTRELERPGVPPRHVLLVTVASLRPDHMSAFAYFRPTTVWEVDPGARALGEGKALDDLAAEGVLFARAFAPSPRTRPSLAALHTGRLPRQNGVVAKDDVLAADQQTLAESFAAAGFRTVAFVSGELPAADDGLLQGFGEVHRDADDVATMELAIEWLEDADLGDWRPLFLWLHLSDPALPYDPAPLAPRPGGDPGDVEYAELFTDPGYTGPADGSVAFVAAARAGERALSEADREHLVALYDGEVARMNSALRKFLTYYHEHGEAIGLWEDTVIAFAGVHGEELGERGDVFGPPDTLHEHALHVPLFLRHPNSMTGQRILDDVVDLTDLHPTLCEWMHVASERSTGRSLLGATDSFRRRDFPERAVLAQRGPDEYGLRTSEWRWIAASEELFRCRDDSAPRRVVAVDDPGAAERARAALQARLEAGGD